VDAAQSLGSLPLAEAGSANAAAAADIYACTGHKWCCGPEGLGAVALSERLLAEGRPTLIGWRSLSQEHSADSAFHADARRYEVATSCIPLMAGLNRSLELLESLGDAEGRLELIRAGSLHLWRELRGMEGVRTLLEEPPPAGLVSFTTPAAPGALVRELGRQAIWLRTLEDPPCLRACCHVTTSGEEIGRLVWALRQRI
jgi:L-cysteine/cystine lyase